MTTSQLYLNRINKAIDYINNNLSEKLSINDICREACFSTYHFHRIFKAFTGESLYAFVTRLRVEKAAYFFLIQAMNQLTVIVLRTTQMTVMIRRPARLLFE